MTCQLQTLTFWKGQTVLEAYMTMKITIIPEFEDLKRYFYWNGLIATASSVILYNILG